VTVTSTGLRSFETKEGQIEEKLAGTVEPKYEWKEHNIELTGKLSTAGEFEGGISFKDLLPGTKVSVTDIVSDKDGTAFKGTVAYKNEHVSLKGGVKYPFKLKTHVNFNAEAVICYPAFLFWGADVRYDTAVRGPPETPENDQPKDQYFLSGKAGAVVDSNQVTVSFENAANKDKKTSKANPVLSTFNLGYFQTVNDAIKVAFGFSAEIKNVKGIEFTAGGEYKVDKDTSLKGKFGLVGAKESADREFRLGLGVKQNVSEHAVVTVGADINARSLLGGPPGVNLGGKPHSFGFEVKFQ